MPRVLKVLECRYIFSSLLTIGVLCTVGLNSETTVNKILILLCEDFSLCRSESRSTENAFMVRIVDRGPPFEYHCRMHSIEW